MGNINLRYYDKMIEEIQTKEKEEIIDSMPTVLTENDVPHLTNVFNFLNKKDKDILFLIFISGKSQVDLIKILNRSQPSISYDIKKIKERIKFICHLHSLFPVFLDWLQNRSSKFSAEQVAAMSLMFFTTSFSQAAHAVNFKSTKIRYLFDKTLKQLKKEDEKEIYEMFLMIRRNLNTIKRRYTKNEKYWG